MLSWLITRRADWLAITGVLILGCAILMHPPLAGAAVSFQGLGDLPGDPFLSRPTVVTPDGSAVVGEASADFETVPFLWTASGGMVQLSGSFRGSAYDATPDHSVIVGKNSNLGFRWTQTGRIVSLGDLPGGNTSSSASAVSVEGNVITGSSHTHAGTGISHNEAFRWTAAGGMVGLGELPGGETGSEALAMSDDGSVIAGVSFVASGEQAFRWTASTGMVPLDAHPAGWTGTIASVMTGDGSVIAGVAQTTAGREAFRWTASGGLVGLGDLPGGAYHSLAGGLNDDGSLIVGFGTTDVGMVATIWDAAHGMRNLQTVLANDYGLNLLGWRLQNATDISPDGRVFIGYGLNPANQSEAWLAVIPEPCGISLFAISAAPLRRRRGSRRCVTARTRDEGDARRSE